MLRHQNKFTWVTPAELTAKEIEFYNLELVVPQVH